jgi:hypothetical protein
MVFQIGRRLVVATFAIVWSVGLIGAGTAALGEEAKKSIGPQAGESLVGMPEDTAFYFSLLRSRQQVEAVGRSRAWQRFLPVVEEAWKGLGKKSEANQWLENPGTRDMLEFVGDLFGQEFFVYGDANYVDFLRLVEKYQRISQKQAVGTLSKLGLLSALMEDDADDDDKDKQDGDKDDDKKDDQKDSDAKPAEKSGSWDQFRLLIHAVAEDPKLLRVPTTIAGFKVTNKDRAREKIAALSGLMSLGAMFVPQLGGRIGQETIDGQQFIVVKLDGKMIPWDDAPLDELREVEVEKGEVDKVVERVKELTLTFTVGLRGDFLLVALGPSMEMLDQIQGKGTLLINRPEFQRFAPFADREVTSVSYSSREFAAKTALSAEDLEHWGGLARQFVDASSLSNKEKDRIRADIAALVKDLGKHVPRPGASLAFSFLTENGMESYAFDWTDLSGTDASRPLGILQHVGGNPLLAMAARTVDAGEGYELLARLAQMGYGYFETYAVPKMDKDDQAKYRQFRDLALPLLARFHKTTRRLAMPSLDGQGGFVLDAKFKTTKLGKDGPKFKEEMPLPEPAIVLGVSDRKALIKAGLEYREVYNGLVDAFCKVEKSSAEPYHLPLPKPSKISGGTIYQYPLDDVPGYKESGVDPRLLPTIGLTGDTLVFTISREHAERLLSATPLSIGGVLADGQRSRGGALAFDWAGSFDTIYRWVSFNLEQSKSEPQTVKTIDATFDLLRCVRTITAESYVDGGVQVSHSAAEVRDAP